MKTLKSFVLVIVLICSIFISLNFITAQSWMTINGTYAGANYSTNLNISAYISFNHTLNLTCWHNESGATTDGFLVEILNTTPSQTTFENATINVSYFNDTRTLNISCIGLNESGHYANASFVITVDNTAPTGTSVSSNTHPKNWGNYSGEIVLFSMNITDPTSNLSSVIFQITNFSNGHSVNYTASRTASTDTWTANINTTKLNDGAYNVTIWAIDYSLNSNGSTIFYNITFDNTGATVTHSCAPLYPNVGDPVTCTCSGADTVSPPHNVSFTASPSTTSEGTKTTTCTITNYAGVNSTYTFTYYVQSGGGSSGGSSGSSSTQTWTSTQIINEEQFKQGFEKQLQVNHRVRVKVENKDHHVGIKQISTSTITIEVSSTPQSATLSVGDERKFDVSGDGYYDLSVKLNSIENNKADVVIKSIREKVTSESESAQEEKEEVAGEIKKEEINEGSTDLTYVWIVIIILLVLIGIGYGAKKKGYF